MLNNLKSYLEKVHVTPISWLVGISGILMVRFFLEAFSSKTSGGFFASDASTLVHYYLFFLSMVVVFMVFIREILPGWKHIAPQLAVFSFLLVFIAPVVDWIISGGEGLRMAYLFDAPREILISFLTFFGKDLSVGITWGIRAEVALALLSLGFVVYFAEKSFKKAIASVVSLYILIFIFLSLPGIMNIIGGAHVAGNYFNQPLLFIQKSISDSVTTLNNIHSSLDYSSVVRMLEISFNFMMGKILFLILAAAAFIWFRLNFKEKLRAVIKNSRPERGAHYILMIALGLFSAYLIFPALKLNWNDWLSVLMLCLSFYFSWMFAVCVNDIADEDIDAVSNASRPLIVKTLDKEEQQDIIHRQIALLEKGFYLGKKLYSRRDDLYVR